jgi:DUF4097 and DUF4098 domain-containing protein YvlB
MLGCMAASGARAETYEESFAVEPGGTLRVTIAGGSIAVEGGDEARVELDAHSAGVSELLVRREGRDVHVTTRPVKGWRGWLGGGGGVDLQARVPQRFDLVLVSSGGNVDVTEIEGNVKVSTSGGRITVSEVKGDVEAKSSGGSIEAREIAGDLEASTSGGPVRISEVRGRVDATSSGGEIRVGDAYGPVRARSLGGPIAVRFAADPAGDLTSSGGAIEVELPLGIGVRVDAEALGGTIEVDEELGHAVERPGRSTLDLALFGGGPALDLRAVGGGIRIRAR